MAKKFGKFLLFTAAVGAAGAAAYYYMQKKDSKLSTDEGDEDYDDFSDTPEASRTYVSLNQDGGTEEAAAKEEPSEENDFTPLAEQVTQVAETAKETAAETVEEFFDEEDDAEEEPTLKETED